VREGRDHGNSQAHQAAVGSGYAGVLMLSPFYYKDVSEVGLYRYFSEVVQCAGDARLPRRLSIYRGIL
jgi:4-hydroxy-tetrahydrodipicolinate synthase